MVVTLEPRRALGGVMAALAYDGDGYRKPISMCILLFRSFLGSALVGLVACAPPVSHSPPPPGSPTHPMSSPLTDLSGHPWQGSASPAAPRVPPLEPPPPPKLAAPLKTEQGKRELDRIRRYCAPAVAIDGTNERVGCACCPPFELCAPKPDAELVEQAEVYTLRASLDGSFSAPGEEERALGFDGCETHPNQGGGALLVKRGEPKQLGSIPTPHENAPVYARDVNPGECKEVHDSKRAIDLLLCHHEETQAGIVHSWVYLYDFSKKSGAGRTSFVDALDNTGAACAGAPEGYPVVVPVLKSLSAKDTNGDGRLDITVTASIRKGAVTKAYTDACERALEWKAGDTSDPKTKPVEPSSTLGPAKPVSLTFVGKADGAFEATPTTKTAIEEIYSELEAFDGPP